MSGHAQVWELQDVARACSAKTLLRAGHELQMLGSGQEVTPDPEKRIQRQVVHSECSQERTEWAWEKRDGEKEEAK